ncbi:MAG: 50S ribosomal protein L30 [Oscillospiraceae bacterium]|nr:50S ribosomal protein L30 [Oscillospiraceae bacterium]
MALNIKLVKSLNSCKKEQIATAYSLGLRKIGDSTTQQDNAAVQGKIRQIAHLIEVTNA